MRNENRVVKKENRGLRKDNRAAYHDSRRKEKMIQKYQEEITLNDALWSTDKNKERLGRDPYRFLAREMLETILSTPSLLRDATSLTVDEFEWLCEGLVVGMEGEEDAPLFSETGSPNAGNRCRLSRKQVPPEQETGAA